MPQTTQHDDVLPLGVALGHIEVRSLAGLEGAHHDDLFFHGLATIHGQAQDADSSVGQQELRGIGSLFVDASVICQMCGTLEDRLHKLCLQSIFSPSQ